MNQARAKRKTRGELNDKSPLDKYIVTERFDAELDKSLVESVSCEK